MAKIGFLMTWLISDCVVSHAYIFTNTAYIRRLPLGANDPKFTDRQVWANSVDPDQTAPKGSALLTIPSASFGPITL